MPALRTEITEIVTGLGMFGYSNLHHAIGMRPPGFDNVDDAVYDRLAVAYQSGNHSRAFATAWSNGVRFARSAVGVGRLPADDRLAAISLRPVSERNEPVRG
ncbi:MAG: hypothetical protein ACXWH0_04685, partial [Acidimicrobiia bacterium]